MVNASSTPSADEGRSIQSRACAPQFQPFEWLRPEELHPSQQDLAAFLNTARDVVQGAHTLTHLLAWDEDRHDAASSEPGAGPLFDARQRSALQRFVAASLDMLHMGIEGQCESLACNTAV